MPTRTEQRSRPDLCPGVLRPWPAEDGGLVRLRLIGGRLPCAALRSVLGVAAAYGDGDVHLTARANLQLRGLPLVEDRLPSEVAVALEDTGLLPSRTHELVRNVMLSPTSSVRGGRADLRAVARELDQLLCASPSLAGLPGRFLFLLDDGRGDLIGRSSDLALMALDDATGQVRLGDGCWGEVVRLDRAATALAQLAERFLLVRGTGATAAWHVDELDAPLSAGRPADARTEVRSAPLAYDDLHIAVPDGRLRPDRAVDVLEQARDRDLVVTPWHGIWVGP